MAIANMDQFRKAVIMQYEAQRARMAVQAVVKKRRASTQMHSVITADVSEGYIAQGAINKSKRICDFWKKKTCYFGYGCKFLHEGPGACIQKPVDRGIKEISSGQEGNKNSAALAEVICESQ